MPEKLSIQKRMDDLNDVTESTKAMLLAVFDNLKTHATVKVDGPQRLFFPNGIELISLKIGLKELVDVEIKIAGEKGLKAAALGENKALEKLTSASLPDTVG